LEISEATGNSQLQFKAAKALLEYFAREFRPDSVSAVLGTARSRIIKQISGNLDVYAERKRLSNQAALKLLPLVQETIRSEPTPERRFRKACLAAIVGNTIEFDIPEHTINLNQLEEIIARAEEELAVDEIREIYERIQKASRILYLADNAGEIALDKLLITELKGMKAAVTVVVKGGPVLNDATMEDAQAVRIFEIADAVITTGTDAIGLPAPMERSKDFIKAYQNCDFVIAKGMGYAETITEEKLTKPHAFLLRTKCTPVAKHFGVSRECNVATLRGT
jgi:uncharacterized protein with ATP-grasp and redox domains